MTLHKKQTFHSRSVMRWAFVLPVHTRPLLTDFIAFPFRVFTADVWLTLGVVVALLYAAATWVPTLTRSFNNQGASVHVHFSLKIS